MRNLLILAILVATPVGAQNAPKPQLGNADCRSASAQRVDGTRVAGPQRLGQLPDAKLFRAVDYREGGCSKPIMVNRTLRR